MLTLLKRYQDIPAATKRAPSLLRLTSKKKTKKLLIMPQVNYSNSKNQNKKN